MLDFLLDIKDDDYDTITFLPTGDPDEINVESRIYEDRGERIGGSKLGDKFHIILFKNDENGVHFDNFESILICPFEYMSNLIKCDWYGIISRKTTTSQERIDYLLNQIKMAIK